MSIASTLQDTKARLDGLLSYANETTGQSDVSIGDAIKTLADGFGGSGGVPVKEFLSSANADPSAGTNGGLSIPVDTTTLNVGDILYIEGQDVTETNNVTKIWLIYGRNNANIQYAQGIWTRYPETQSSNLGGSTIAYDAGTQSLKVTASNSWKFANSHEYKLYRIGNVMQ